MLVVGDFDRARRGGEFAAQVWEGVTAEYLYETPRSRASNSPIDDYARIAEQIARTSDGECEKLMAARRWGPRRRPVTRSPIPLRLGHGPDADTDQFRDDLRRVLDKFDVWGIIAAGSAHNLVPIRDALQGVDIPLLVTTDSTTVGSATTMPTELRLMPSNRGQATVMLLAGVLAAARSGRALQPRDALATSFPEISYVAETTLQARKYADDLTTQLKDEAHRLGIPLGQEHAGETGEGPLLVIGYDPIAEQIATRRREGGVTILSDGCATAAARETVTKRRRTDSDCWFVAAPSVSLSDLGEHSFAAIAVAGNELAMGKRSERAQQDVLVEPLRDRIRELLTGADKDRFVFEGVENVAPLYEIKSLGPAEDAAGQ